MNAARTHTGDHVIIYGVYATLSQTAKDGTTFTPAKFYDVASRNIGVLRTDPNGRVTAYADALFADPEYAQLEARKMCEAYDQDR